MKEPSGRGTRHPAHAGPAAQRGPCVRLRRERDDAARATLVLESLQYARSLFGKAIGGERGVRLPATVTAAISVSIRVRCARSAHAGSYRGAPVRRRSALSRQTSMSRSSER